MKNYQAPQNLLQDRVILVTGAGQSIGHKRIQSFARQKLAAVRLRFTKSIAPPVIRRLAAFDTRP